MAEKLLVKNEPSSSPVAIQRGLSSFYNHANFCSFLQPKRKGSSFNNGMAARADAVCDGRRS